MAVTYALSGYWRFVAAAMLRATNGVGSGQIGTMGFYTAGAALVKYKASLTSANWGTPASGKVTMASLPILLTHSGNGAIAECKLEVGGGSPFISGLEPQIGSGGHILLDDINITAAEAANIVNFYITQEATAGTVSLNTLLRNRMLSFLVKINSNHFSANGTIKVYDGAAPDVDAAATGTELISFPIDTTSSFSYADATGTPNASALVAPISATASATGTAGYARLSWTHSAETYVIQGSCGAGAEDFVVSSASMTATSSYDLTAATLTF